MTRTDISMLARTSARSTTTRAGMRRPDNEPTASPEPEERYPGAALCPAEPFSFGRMALLLAISLLAVPIGSLGVILYGIATCRRRRDMIVWYEDEPRFAYDRRIGTYKRTGMVRSRKTEYVPAVDASIPIYRTNGIIAIAIGCLGPAFMAAALAV